MIILILLAFLIPYDAFAGQGSSATRNTPHIEVAVRSHSLMNQFVSISRTRKKNFWNLLVKDMPCYFYGYYTGASPVPFVFLYNSSGDYAKSTANGDASPDEASLLLVSLTAAAVSKTIAKGLTQKSFHFNAADIKGHEQRIAILIKKHTLKENEPAG